MAVTTLSPRSSEHQSSISNMISRLLSKKKKNPKRRDEQAEQKQEQDTRPQLIHAPVPLVLPEHQDTLLKLGWTTITFPGTSPTTQSPDSLSSIPPPGPHPLQIAYQDLFSAGQAFFNLADSEKHQWKHRLGSEEGWSKIPGEKEFITLRSLAYCPEILRAPAQRYWELVGKHCSSTLGRISTALGLPDGENEGLRQFVGPCARMPVEEEGKTATMLRLFRYEGWEEKVVAEAHADLGLISVVVGDTPGLEVWDGAEWFDVEREVERKGGKGATMLVGRQLERLTNERLRAGGHRVVAYGGPRDVSSGDGVDGMETRYRHSIVFVLRAHEGTQIDSDALETRITGRWKQPMNGVTAGALYEMIRSQCFNINVEKEERDAQRRKLADAKGVR
ncbi:hypothetical protein COCCADRAFT_99486 [Bipolaris zeicola 26-R-13]|uniref:Isopenicillin N synthase-like Fe(2+) 2OG dioxygenase domain-containing protein n=1 Tax=Cochliobolus carbonum (strain 26-R-13) TaxID=930089 RepID=W6XXD1_COCC2|nr:uncharacterized protein COCCADRAFT_99486 [Bipolaris zeicola 26-R-13]EUC32132.1 hypothetical protein COCCADRAFT_99486 [Bipolaris zeicola 26-R-13]